MEEYFSGKEKLDELYKELESWVGTRYRYWSGVKQRGVDCIHLIVRVMEATGCLQGRVIVIPKYPYDWHLHNGEPLLKNGIEKLLPQIRIKDKSKIKSGDVVLYKYGLQAAHSGIYYNGKVYQSITSNGVYPMQWRDQNFYSRVRYIYRMIKI